MPGILHDVQNRLWFIFAYVISFFKLTWLKQILARNLRKPSNHFLARYIMSKLFESSNIEVERLAVEKCDIQQSDNVLEVGFGPGLGLEFVVQHLQKNKNGKLYGADYSQSMVDAASRRMKSYIQDGLVELHLASVSKLPFDNAMFDKVFHTNVFYFWDDQIGCCIELLRVLKPGGLMIAALDLKKVAASAALDFLNKETSDVDNFLVSLQTAGFVDVNMKTYVRDGVSYGCIYASRAVEK